MIRCESLTKTYLSGGRELTVLNGITFEMESGGFLAVVGPSGSGKSTLLGLLAGLDRATSGTVRLDGQDLGALDEDQRARLRAQKVGFVFQSFHLIPQLSVAENVETPLLYGDVPEAEWRPRALRCLERVGLVHRADHRPSELSGGEAQRAAIARALVTEPALLLADEPTGNLDSRTGEEVASLLDALHAEGRTVVLVTHNEALGRRAERVVRLRDGRVEGDTLGEERS